MSSSAESEWLRSNASRRCQHTLQHWRLISPAGEYRQYKGIKILLRRYSTMAIKRTTLFRMLAIEKSQCQDGGPILSSYPVSGLGRISRISKRPETRRRLRSRGYGALY